MKINAYLFSISILLLTACGPQYNEQEQAAALESIEWINFEWEQWESGGKLYDKAGLKIPITMHDTTTLYVGMDFTQYTNVPDEGIMKKHFKINQEYKADAKSNEPVDKQRGKPAIKIVNELSKATWRIKPQDVIHEKVGFIGMDELEGRILIVDHPQARLALLDSLPLPLSSRYEFFDFKIRSGMITFMAEINGKRCRLTYNIGMNIMPLLVSDGLVFRQMTDARMGVDTLREVGVDSYWGTITYDIIPGAAMREPLLIDGVSLNHPMVYYIDSELDRKWNKKTVGMAGFALFTDTEICIDFQHQRFGIKK